MKCPFSFILLFFSQDEGADLPFAPPMKGNLFLVPNGVRPVMQRTAIEVCLLESVQCRCQKLLTSYCKLLVFLHKYLITLNRRYLVRTLVITNIQRDFKEHRSRRGSLLRPVSLLSEVVLLALIFRKRFLVWEITNAETAIWNSNMMSLTHELSQKTR